MKSEQLLKENISTTSLLDEIQESVKSVLERTLESLLLKTTLGTGIAEMEKNLKTSQKLLTALRGEGKKPNF